MPDTINFCTLFDKNYLTRGLVTHESLIQSAPNAQLYIFPFDDECLQILLQLNLERATIIPLKEFEDDELLSIKNTRSKVEYCWTCTPSIILYAIEKYNLPSCTYIDSDMLFFNSPEILLDELKNEDAVLLTEHRYTPEFDSTAASGRFCVQFMTFNNNEKGLTALKWWREKCIEWCYHIAQDGKLGDQGYIQDWDTKFEGTVVMQHLGGGLAPWNIQQYDFTLEQNVLKGIEIKIQKKFQPVFYHFHYLRFYNNREIKLTDYPLTDSHKIFIYYPYLLLLEKKKSLLLEKFNINFNPHGATDFIFSLPQPLSRKSKLKRAIKKLIS